MEVQKRIGSQRQAPGRSDMYLKYFRLHDFAFSISPNTDFYLNMASSREALKMIALALKGGDGFIKITGPIGTGKTLLCRKLLNSLGEDCIPIYIANPALSDLDIYRIVAEGLGLEEDAALNGHQLTNWLTNRLMQCQKEGKKAVLIIDEAQALTDKALEAVRLLTNIETEKRKLIQIILFGQLELDYRLNKPSFLQLKQRILFSHRLQPLDYNAIRGYIRHRLFIAGHKGKGLFSKDAIKLLHKASQGIPRLINILSHKAMIVAYQQGQHAITRASVRVAIQETESAFQGALRRMYGKEIACGVALACVVALLKVVF
jgi:MSHA biogenesis protein MshM